VFDPLLQVEVFEVETPKLRASMHRCTREMMIVAEEWQYVVEYGLLEVVEEAFR